MDSFLKTTVLILLGVAAGGIGVGVIWSSTSEPSCSSHFADLRWEVSTSFPVDTYPLVLLNGTIRRNFRYMSPFHKCHHNIPMLEAEERRRLQIGCPPEANGDPMSPSGCVLFARIMRETTPPPVTW